MIDKPQARHFALQNLFLLIIFLIAIAFAAKPALAHNGGHAPVQPAEQSPPPIEGPTQPNALFEIPVLALSYIPLDPANPYNLDKREAGFDTYFPNQNFQAADVPTWIEQMSIGHALLAGSATKFRGHLYPYNLQYLSFKFHDINDNGNAFDDLVYYEAMPRGHIWRVREDGVDQHRPHYRQILDNINICDFVDDPEIRIKEVWIWGYHGITADAGNTIIEPDESRMSSDYGDVSNSLPKEETLPDDLRMPRCENAYTMYNFTYQPPTPSGDYFFANTLHNRLHQIENALFFAETGDTPAVYGNVGGSIFFSDFAVFGTRGDVPDYRASCGNSHYPPNTVDNGNLPEGYPAYQITTYVENNCETWHMNDYLTTYEMQNCDTWGCTDYGFYGWWMRNLPGYDNQISVNDCDLRNWWDAILDFNAFIDPGLGLMTCSRPWLSLGFDGSFDGENGEGGSASALGVNFVNGHTGRSGSDQAVLITPGGTLTYETANNINRSMGSIEFWVKPRWDGNNGNTQVFFEVGDSWYNRMRIVKDGANNLRFMVWSDDAEYDVAYNISDWVAYDWHHVRVEWDETNLDLYVDDIIRDTQPHIGLPSTLPPTMYVGSTYNGTFQADAVIDDLTISGAVNTDVPTAIALSETATTAETAGSTNLIIVVTTLMTMTVLLGFRLRKQN